MKKTRNEYHINIRKCKKLEKFIINNKLIENCFQNDLDLFAEIKKARKIKPDIAASIDGVSGNEIPEKFGKVYSELFNKLDDEENLKNILLVINHSISN